MTTKIPPLKSKINPIFFSGFKVVFQSMGTGMEMRYKSVATLKAK